MALKVMKTRTISMESITEVMKTTNPKIATKRAIKVIKTPANTTKNPNQST